MKDFADSCIKQYNYNKSQNNMYNKRIVCDLDDTISFCNDRNFSNATPNQSVIDKINELFKLGWEVFIVTARGCISCDSREDADSKYRPQIETWLKDHGVNYTKLSFQKELAAYYIDDKALRPDEFVELEIKNLQNGWSGATVELRGNKVYKTAPNSLDAVQWYKVASNFDIKVPEVHSIIGDTICMEYIDYKKDLSESDKFSMIKSALDLINTMKSKPFFGNSLMNGIENYVSRLQKHIHSFKNYDMAQIGDYCIDELLDWNEYEDLNSNEFLSLCHGDLTIDNMLLSDGTVWFIDPIYEPTKLTYSSWILDLSKLIYSIELHDIDIDEVLRKYETEIKEILGDLPISILNVFVVSHCIRVWNYAPNSMKDKIKQIAQKYTN